MYVCIYLRFAQPWRMRGGGGALLISQNKNVVRHIEQLKFIPKLDIFFITLHLFEIRLNLEQDRQSRYNVTLWRVSVTTVAVENRYGLHILCVCVFVALLSCTHSACAISYCHI